MIAGRRVSFKPRSAPAEAACRPSENWNAAASTISCAASAATSASLVHRLAIVPAPNSSTSAEASWVPAVIA